jgi:hypothetical protein
LDYQSYLTFEGATVASSKFDMSITTVQAGIHLHVKGGLEFITKISGSYNDPYNNSKKYSFQYKLKKETDQYCLPIL